MTIASKAELERALQCRFSKLNAQKVPVNAGNAGTGFYHSYWYIQSGFPPSGLAPTATVAALSNATTGALPFMQQTSPLTSYLADLSVAGNLAGQTVEIHDRLIQITIASVSTTALTVTGFDLNSFLATNNIGNRIGDANYSDVQWWVEIPADGAGTASNLTVSVIYNDGSTGNLTAFAIDNRRQSRMFPLNYLIPAADSGKYIRAITSAIGSASSTGAIAFVATRYRAAIYLELAGNKIFNKGWTELGMPEIYNQSCLFPIIIAPGTTVTGITIGGSIVHG